MITEANLDGSIPRSTGNLALHAQGDVDLIGYECDWVNCVECDVIGQLWGQIQGHTIAPAADVVE